MHAQRSLCTLHLYTPHSAPHAAPASQDVPLLMLAHSLSHAWQLIAHYHDRRASSQPAWYRWPHRLKTNAPLFIKPWSGSLHDCKASWVMCTSYLAAAVWTFRNFCRAHLEITWTSIRGCVCDNRRRIKWNQLSSGAAMNGNSKLIDTLRCAVNMFFWAGSFTVSENEIASEAAGQYRHINTGQ